MHFTVAAMGLLLALGGAHCGSTAPEGVPAGNPDGGDGGGHPGNPDTGPANPNPPTNHRPAPVACATTRPPGLNEDAGVDSGLPGLCTNDSECTQGTNGRCLPPGGNAAGDLCSYDQCATDSQCPSGNVCQCGAPGGTYGRAGNTCVPSNCKVDADCGNGGYCSPTEAPSCGSRSGIVGYYCHGPGDACTNDSDCIDGGVGGYCAWQSMTGKWACSYGICSG